MRKRRIHHGFKYTVGRNVCPSPFDPTEGVWGGLYGCRLKDLLKWVTLYEDIDSVAIVTIPPTAQCVWFDEKFKTSELVINRYIPLEDAIDIIFRRNMCTHTDKIDALRKAASYGYIPITQLLLDRGVCNDDALLQAARNGQLNIVDLLLNKLTDIPSSLNDAIECAARAGYTDIVQRLLKYSIQRIVR
jgi:hypothetical protein